MLKAVEKKRAYEDIVKQIRHLIERGRLKRGDQLPVERELSETFKVSRATVREAIFSLEAVKLVQRRQGDGTYVIASSEEALVQPLAAALFHEKDDLIDIFSIRRMVEPEVAQLASEKATPEEVKELEEILKEQEREVASGKNPVQTDSEFHHLLARMARNRVLERLLLALFDLLGKTREKYLQTEERKQKSLQGHYAILTAVKHGHGMAARQAMRRHLEDVEDTLFKKKKRGVKTASVSSFSGKASAKVK
ncbi:MAG: FadR family transcriptional regulator [Desulfobacterales bacterium]|nr:FadR family transcriptional regulator [Desulfobacterales bacterium]